MAIELNEFCELAETQKKKSIETLSSIVKAVRNIQEQDDINKQLKDIIIKELKAPRYLSFLEKVVFYYNRKQGIPLETIGEVTGFHPIYINQISVKINEKIKLHKKK